ncbi:hypothetical protein PthBH41_28270 [Parageobacillus thermoglucosidasius]|nr:hypothetical protein PthBH41_28270 [Parageobacillus thermoglucosidasius]
MINPAMLAPINPPIWFAIELKEFAERSISFGITSRISAIVEGLYTWSPSATKKAIAYKCHG